MAKKDEKAVEHKVAFNLAVAYNVEFQEQPEDVDFEYANLTAQYMEYAVTSRHKEGLDSQFRRLYSSIQKKIQMAMNTKTYVVSFTEGEFNFIKEAFANEKTKFVPQVAKYVVELEDALDGCDRILKDEFSDFPEKALYMIGAIAQAPKPSGKI